MRYFVPDIYVAAEVAAETNVQDKFGGIPWGLSRNKWPTCRDCGRSQSLLAQLTHDSQRLDLGRGGRVLFVFQCNHDPGMCETWDANSGANACFVVESENLGDTLSALPNDTPLVENEVRVRTWIERDDGLPDSLISAFYSSRGLNALSDDIRRRVTSGTRLGGVPLWIQSPEEAPRADWQFVGQLDSGYSFLSPPRGRHAWVSEDRNRWEGRTHFGQGPNFGDGGIAYLFLRRGAGAPDGRVFWQCG